MILKKEITAIGPNGTFTGEVVVDPGEYSVSIKINDQLVHKVKTSIESNFFKNIKEAETQLSEHLQYLAIHQSTLVNKPISERLKEMGYAEENSWPSIDTSQPGK